MSLADDQLRPVDPIVPFTLGDRPGEVPGFLKPFATALVEAAPGTLIAGPFRPTGARFVRGITGFTYDALDRDRRDAGPEAAQALVSGEVDDRLRSVVRLDRSDVHYATAVATAARHARPLVVFGRSPDLKADERGDAIRGLSLRHVSHIGILPRSDAGPALDRWARDFLALHERLLEQDIPYSHTSPGAGFVLDLVRTMNRGADLGPVVRDHWRSAIVDPYPARIDRDLTPPPSRAEVVRSPSSDEAPLGYDQVVALLRAQPGLRLERPVHAVNPVVDAPTVRWTVTPDGSPDAHPLNRFAAQLADTRRQRARVVIDPGMWGAGIPAAIDTGDGFSLSGRRGDGVHDFYLSAQALRSGRVDGDHDRHERGHLLGDLGEGVRVARVGAGELLRPVGGYESFLAFDEVPRAVQDIHHVGGRVARLERRVAALDATAGPDAAERARGLRAGALAEAHDELDRHLPSRRDIAISAARNLELAERATAVELRSERRRLYGEARVTRDDGVEQIYRLRLPDATPPERALDEFRARASVRGREADAAATFFRDVRRRIADARDPRLTADQRAAAFTAIVEGDRATARARDLAPDELAAAHREGQARMQAYREGRAAGTEPFMGTGRFYGEMVALERVEADRRREIGAPSGPATRTQPGSSAATFTQLLGGDEGPGPAVPPAALMDHLADMRESGRSHGLATELRTFGDRAFLRVLPSADPAAHPLARLADELAHAPLATDLLYDPQTLEYAGAWATIVDAGYDHRHAASMRERFGSSRPALILPRQDLGTLDPSDPSVAHEVGHVRRGVFARAVAIEGDLPGAPLIPGYGSGIAIDELNAYPNEFPGMLRAALREHDAGRPIRFHIQEISDLATVGSRAAGLIEQTYRKALDKRSTIPDSAIRFELGTDGRMLGIARIEGGSARIVGDGPSLVAEFVPQVYEIRAHAGDVREFWADVAQTAANAGQRRTTLAELGRQVDGVAEAIDAAGAGPAHPLRERIAGLFGRAPQDERAGVVRERLVVAERHAANLLAVPPVDRFGDLPIERIYDRIVGDVTIGGRTMPASEHFLGARSPVGGPSAPTADEARSPIPVGAPAPVVLHRFAAPQPEPIDAVLRRIEQHEADGRLTWREVDAARGQAVAAAARATAAAARYGDVLERRPAIADRSLIFAHDASGGAIGTAWVPMAGSPTRVVAVTVPASTPEEYWRAVAAGASTESDRAASLGRIAGHLEAIHAPWIERHAIANRESTWMDRIAAPPTRGQYDERIRRSLAEARAELRPGSAPAPAATRGDPGRPEVTALVASGASHDAPRYESVEQALTRLRRREVDGVLAPSEVRGVHAALAEAAADAGAAARLHGDALALRGAIPDSAIEFHRDAAGHLVGAVAVPSRRDPGRSDRVAARAETPAQLWQAFEALAADEQARADRLGAVADRLGEAHDALIERHALPLDGKPSLVDRLAPRPTRQALGETIRDRLAAAEAEAQGVHAHRLPVAEAETPTIRRADGGPARGFALPTAPAETARDLPPRVERLDAAIARIQHGFAEGTLAPREVRAVRAAVESAAADVAAVADLHRDALAQRGRVPDAAIAFRRDAAGHPIATIDVPSRRDPTRSVPVSARAGDPEQLWTSLAAQAASEDRHAAALGAVARRLGSLEDGLVELHALPRELRPSLFDRIAAPPQREPLRAAASDHLAAAAAEAATVPHATIVHDGEPAPRRGEGPTITPLIASSARPRGDGSPRAAPTPGEGARPVDRGAPMTGEGQLRAYPGVAAARLRGALHEHEAGNLTASHLDSLLSAADAGFGAATIIADKHGRALAARSLIPDEAIRFERSADGRIFGVATIPTNPSGAGAPGTFELHALATDADEYWHTVAGIKAAAERQAQRLDRMSDHLVAARDRLEHPRPAERRAGAPLRSTTGDAALDGAIRDDLIAAAALAGGPRPVGRGDPARHGDPAAAATAHPAPRRATTSERAVQAEVGPAMTEHDERRVAATAPIGDPPPRRRRLEGDDALVDGVRAKIVVEPDHGTIWGPIGRARQAKAEHVLDRFADRLKRRGLTDIEREQFRFAVTDPGTRDLPMAWRLHEEGGHSDTDGGRGGPKQAFWFGKTFGEWRPDGDREVYVADPKTSYQIFRHELEHRRDDADRVANRVDYWRADPATGQKTYLSHVKVHAEYRVNLAAFDGDHAKAYASTWGSNGLRELATQLGFADQPPRIAHAILSEVATVDRPFLISHQVVPGPALDDARRIVAETIAHARSAGRSAPTAPEVAHDAATSPARMEGSATSAPSTGRSAADASVVAPAPAREAPVVGGEPAAASAHPPLARAGHPVAIATPRGVAGATGATAGAFVAGLERIEQSVRDHETVPQAIAHVAEASAGAAVRGFASAEAMAVGSEALAARGFTHATAGGAVGAAVGGLEGAYEATRESLARGAGAVETARDAVVGGAGGLATAASMTIAEKGLAAVGAGELAASVAGGGGVGALHGGYVALRDAQARHLGAAETARAVGVGAAREGVGGAVMSAVFRPASRIAVQIARAVPVAGPLLGAAAITTGELAVLAHEVAPAVKILQDPRSSLGRVSAAQGIANFAATWHPADGGVGTSTGGAAASTGGWSTSAGAAATSTGAAGTPLEAASRAAEAAYHRAHPGAPAMAHLAPVVVTASRAGDSGHAVDEHRAHPGGARSTAPADGTSVARHGAADDARRDGRRTLHDEHGRPVASGEFRRGVPVGDHVEYRDGVPIATTTYSDAGERLRTRPIDPAVGPAPATPRIARDVPPPRAR